MRLLIRVFLAKLLVDAVWSQVPTSDYSNKNKRISETKCDEYEKYVVDQEKIKLFSLFDNEASKTKHYKCRFADDDVIETITSGGVDAQYGEFPHMALVGYKNGANVNFYCGGSLISENFVLTAAHCKKKEIGKTTNYARFNTVKIHSEQAIDRSGTFISHPSYSLDRKNYDIALLKLSQSFNFAVDQRVFPACLHSDSDGIELNIGKATGWGYTEFGQSEMSEDLQKVRLFIIDCKSRREKNLVNVFCASGPKQDTCQGDSGGPLQIEKTNFEGKYTCQMIVIGVTSAGSPGCGLMNSYGIYTKVSKFLDWIEQNVWPIGSVKLQSAQNVWSATTTTTTTNTQEPYWIWPK